MPDESPEAIIRRLSSGYVRVAWSAQAWCQFIPDHVPTRDEFFAPSWSFSPRRAVEALELAKKESDA